MGVGEPGGNVGAHAREPLLTERPILLDQGFEVPAGDVLHYYVRDLAPLELVLARVVDLHYVWVGEPCGRAPLAPEAGPDIGAAVLGVEDLDGDGSVQNLVPAEKDHRHAARPEPAVQLLDYLPTHCARKGLQGPTQTLERLRRKRLFGIAQGLLRFMVRLD